MHLKLLPKNRIQKAAGTTVDLSGNKIADRITKVSKTLPKNNSETITNEHHKKYLKKDIYLQKNTGNY